MKKRRAEGPTFGLPQRPGYARMLEREREGKSDRAAGARRGRDAERSESLRPNVPRGTDEGPPPRRGEG